MTRRGLALGERRNAGVQGFTLIELLISIILMIILLSAVTMVFVHTTETVTVSQARTQVYTEARRATDLLEEDLLAVARREFSEEVGSQPPETGPGGALPIPLGTIVQKGGKVVHAWAIEGELDPEAAVSNTFEMEWPPRSGRRQVFPEIDRIAWFSPADARVRLKPTQIPLIDRLVDHLAAGVTPKPDGG